MKNRSSHSSIRLFKSDFMEFWTKVHPLIPLILYLPFIGFLIQRGFEHELGFLKIATFFVLGILSWSLTEYLIHRFLFHFSPKGKLAKRLFFLFHGVHHEDPSDPLRLVMPPSVSVPLAFLFYYLFGVLLGQILRDPFLAGFGIGYLFYDMTHYLVHHWKMKSRAFNFLKRNHLKHHFQTPNLRFGVSSPVWDFIFKTYS